MMNNTNNSRKIREMRENLGKAQVLQEFKQTLRSTSSSHKELVNTLTKCISMLMRGEQLVPEEANDLYVQFTFLFQFKDCKDSTLRRLTHVAIKILSRQARDRFAAFSCLSTDVRAPPRDNPIIRASALRALCQIADATTWTTIERCLKQCIVDKNPVVAAAAISSLIKIGAHDTDIVKRCTNEVQEALKSKSPMVQYLALGLRYNSCMNDRLAVSRLISNCIQQGLRSPLATCLLIKIITKFIENNVDEDKRQYRDYVRNQLSHQSEMVEYEAANALVTLNDPRERGAAVAHLRNFLTPSNPALGFAAVRSLNRLAIVAPSDVRECNLDLEKLISQSESNRSIAIVAITTLLKTGTESSVEKFLKQLGEFLSEIDDGFKVVVVNAIRQLCQKYPSKCTIIMDFLSNMLKEEGGYAYKEAIIDTIIKIMEDNEETREKGLEQLCEFIEDCEHVSLSVQVLNLLGKEGPKTKKASTYIRFIANRLLLDSSPVASVATTALAKFGVVPELEETIKTALERFSLHVDYEVMERALFYKNILSVADKSFKHKFIVNPNPKLSFQNLESRLAEYLNTTCEEPFDFNSVAEEVEVKKVEVEELIEDNTPPELFTDLNLGKVLKSTSAISLTDSVSEFGVRCIKHIYNRHLVLQLNCTNTVNTMQLENVSVEMCAPAGFRIVASTECPKISYEDIGSIYVCVELEEESFFAMTYFTNIILKYSYRFLNPKTNELESEDEVFEDIFPLEDLLVDMTDFMLPLNKDFNQVWNQELKEEDQLDDSFTLPLRRLELFVRDIVEMLGMEVYNNTDQVPAGKRSHEILLGSVFHGKTDVLMKVALVEARDSISVKVNVRSEDKELACTVMQMFAS